MAKSLNGGALISYGASLPTASVTPDGALFYKTSSIDGVPQGLYVYGFVRDNQAGVLGYQTAQVWVQAASPDLYVLKTGDTMLGALQVPSYIKITAATGQQRLLIGDRAAGVLPIIFNSLGGTLTIANGSTWQNEGGTLSGGLTLTPAGGATGIQWLGNRIWHAGNDGSGSTLDADLLDGQDGTYYLNPNNFSGGTTSVANGGTGNNSVVVGGIAYGQISTKIAYTAMGSAGQVLTSASASTPLWVNQSSLSVGSATNANYANTAGAATSAGTVPWTGVTGFPTTQYVNRSGDTMTGSLTLTSGGSVIAVNGIRLDFDSNSVYAPNSVYAAGAVYAGLYGSSGVVQLNNGGGSNSGYLSFNGPNGGRVGYIGNAPGNQSQDNGVLTYVGQYHNFSGSIVTNGNVTAYSSDARLKKNIKLIDNAVSKVISIGGYSYDWDIDKCDTVGFKPTNEHEHGLIAQEVQKVMPDAVAPAPFNPEYLTVRYERIVALLSAAIAEQQASIQSMSARIKKLENK